MRKKEFVDILAAQLAKRAEESDHKPHLSRMEVRRLSNLLLQELITTIKNGDRAEIRGFGTFFSRHRDARTLRSPRTGEVIEVPARLIPRFKAGKKLSRLVDKHR